jgi:glutaredoxin 3
MPHITVYTTGTCPYCIRAKQLLAARGVTDTKKSASTCSPSSAWP